MRLTRGAVVTTSIGGPSGKPRPFLVLRSDHFAEHSLVTLLAFTSTLTEALTLRVTVAPSLGNGFASAITGDDRSRAVGSCSAHQREIAASPMPISQQSRAPCRCIWASLIQARRDGSGQQHDHRHLCTPGRSGRGNARRRRRHARDRTWGKKAPVAAANDDRKSAIVTAKNPPRRRFADVPDMTPEPPRRCSRCALARAGAPRARGMTGRPVPRRHWRSYGTEPLPTGSEAMDEPLSAFPSWFMRITCDRCGKDRMLSVTHATAAQRDLPIRDIIARMRHDGCGGRAGGTGWRPIGRSLRRALPRPQF